MDYADILKSVVTTRVRAAVLAAVMAIGYLPYAITAYRTHMGVPSLPGLLGMMVWPGLIALLLCAMYTWLPAELMWVWQRLWESRRRRILRLIAGVMWVAIGAAMLIWPATIAPRVFGLAFLISAAALAPVLAIPPRVERSEADRDSESEWSAPEPGSLAEHARSTTLMLVVSLTLPLVLLSYALMARLPVAAGGLREKSVQIAVVTTGMPPALRSALIGDSAQSIPATGSELSLPLRILRRDENETFLWMSTGRGISVPNNRIVGKLDYEDIVKCCTAG